MKKKGGTIPNIVEIRKITRLLKKIHLVGLRGSEIIDEAEIRTVSNIEVDTK